MVPGSRCWFAMDWRWRQSVILLNTYWFERVLQGWEQFKPHVRENGIGCVNDSRMWTKKSMDRENLRCKIRSSMLTCEDFPRCPSFQSSWQPLLLAEQRRQEGWWPHWDPAEQACSWPSTPWPQIRKPRRSPSPLCPQPDRPRRWCAQTHWPTTRP